MEVERRNDTSLATEVRRLLERHARSAVLRYLDAAPGNTLNDRIVRDLLDLEGMRLAHDDVEGLLTWLSCEGLLTLDRRGGVTVISLLSRGADVAQGRTNHDSIEGPMLAAQ